MLKFSRLCSQEAISEITHVIKASELLQVTSMQGAKADSNLHFYTLTLTLCLTLRRKQVW